jgi:MerR family copper efflux transcriptional regulator
VVESLRIGQLARGAGVAVSTVRYYERSGLIRPERRTAANYRVYGVLALERLRFIRAAKESGFTLDDIATLVALTDRKTAPPRVQALIRQRLADLDRRIAELVEMRRVLGRSLRACRAAEKGGSCRILEDLDQAASRPVRNPRGRKQ